MNRIATMVIAQPDRARRRRAAPPGGPDDRRRDTTVPVKGIRADLVLSLHRAAGGWFVVASKSLREESLRGTYVDEDGRSTDIACSTPGGTSTSDSTRS